MVEVAVARVTVVLVVAGVLLTLEHLLRGMLDRYETTREEDTAELAALRVGAEPRRAAAIRLRLSEKHVLHSSLKHVGRMQRALQLENEHGEL